MKRLFSICLAIMIFLSGCGAGPIKLISFYHPEKTFTLGQLLSEGSGKEPYVGGEIKLYEDRIYWHHYYFFDGDPWKYANKIAWDSTMEDVNKLLGEPYCAGERSLFDDQLYFTYLITADGKTTQELSGAEYVVQFGTKGSDLHSIKMFILCYDERQMFSFTQADTGITVDFSDALDDVTERLGEMPQSEFVHLNIKSYTYPQSGLTVIAAGQLILQIHADPSWLANWDEGLYDRADAYYPSGEGAYMEDFDHNGEVMLVDFATGGTSFLNVTVGGDHSLFCVLLPMQTYRPPADATQ